MLSRFVLPIVVLALGIGVAPAAGQTAKPKILLYYDMEGISGISRPEQTSFRHSADYQPARAFLTGDVNAAIRGLVAGGAGAIVVTDAHGSGNPEPDILLDQLDERATFEWRAAPFDPYRDLPNDSYRAIVTIGMHARANTPGFLAHTYTIHPAFRVNGKDITETEIIAHFAAPHKVPVIMVSGDDVLQRQIAERFPLAEYGLVKRAKGRAAAEVLPEEKAWKNIEVAAKKAIEKLEKFKPFPVAQQYQWEMGWQNPEQNELAMKYPGLKAVNDHTVGYTTASFLEGYDRAVTLIEITGAEQSRLLFQVVSERPEGKAILEEYERRLIGRWVNPSAVKPAPARPKPTKYHGDR